MEDVKAKQISGQLEQDYQNLEQDLVQAGSLKDLEQVKVKYLGKKSQVVTLLKNIGSLSRELKPVVGKNANIYKKKIEALIADKEKTLESIEFDQKLKQEKLDLSLPGRKPLRGSKNILDQVTEEIEDIFISMGFSVAQGPEVETDYYNFEALNTPPDHPARSLHDTFFISKDVLLRTHTSPVQIRYMEQHQPPVYIIAPGKVYRKDYDVSHTPMFTQIEGLVVDEGINFCHLKWTLETVARKIFGQDRQVRFRPHYFPFTEPSAEVDVSCQICQGAGCRVCSGSGWLEILGAGMVDPSLYGFVGYDEEKVSGFAFGMGIERICMLRYGIDDLRSFFENDLRFLEQF
ncbi:MAG: phenylalanine--tRNA ligase subunit alpha [Actinomycetota bacterium]|jgi:phenylalanyl-tRNA synthetase alpha chain|nr:phenylalanine--tRNA ligase subunit alpha [Actinomycetota bacterium]